MMTEKELDALVFENYHSRESRLIAVFTTTTAPKLSVTESQSGVCTLFSARPSHNHYEADLAQFLPEFVELKKGEFFVLGRLPECDHRIGLEDVKKYFKNHGDSEENAEYYYMRNAVTVSRIHCFVKNNQDGTFSLYDISTAGTCIIL